jgi:transposase InsO family protein
MISTEVSSLAAHINSLYPSSYRLCRLLGAKQLFTTVYHPSANVHIERFNQTIFKSVTHFVSEHQHDRDEIAGVATHT